MMNIKNYFAGMIALTVWPALAMPCRAQDNPAGIPVLKRYIGRDWIYFASAGDGALIFENRPGDASNVWVAVERAPLNRRILAKTDIWTDGRGHLHTVNVLRRQIEFNDYVKATRALDPNLYWGNGVEETGILDLATLAIPNTKLYLRAKKIANRLVAEEVAAKDLENKDESAAIIKKKFASYLKEKVWIATTLLNELNRAIFAVPRSTPGEEVPVARPDAGNLSGLRGLEIPVITSGSLYDLELAGDGSGVVRFVSGYEPEELKTEFIDPLRMTPAIVADIQAKEAAAEKAVIFAETLCKDLLTPPCE